MRPIMVDADAYWSRCSLILPHIVLVLLQFFFSIILIAVDFVLKISAGFFQKQFYNLLLFPWQPTQQANACKITKAKVIILVLINSIFYFVERSRNLEHVKSWCFLRCTPFCKECRILWQFTCKFLYVVTIPFFFEVARAHSWNLLQRL